MASTDTARKVVFAHAGIGSGANTPPFLGALRPFTGLNEDSFVELLAAIVSISPALESNLVDRQLVHVLWAICSSATLWGISEDGPLRRNRLINDGDWRLLQRWIRIIERTVQSLLEGDREVGDAFISVAEYIAERNLTQYREVFLPMFIRGLNSADPDVRQAMAAAIGIYGPAAERAAGPLRAALGQPLRETHAGATAEVQAEIMKALRRISENESA